MKKLLAVVVTAILAVGLAALAVAAPASAHNSTVTPTCSSLSVDLTNYATKSANDKSNTVKVVVDGATKINTTFGSTFSGVYSYTSNVSHTWSVTVVAYDSSQYNVNKSGTTTLCPSIVTPPSVTFTEPTCSVTHGLYTVPSMTGVTYKVGTSTVAAGAHTVAAGGSVTVTAVASSSSYTLTGTSSWSHTFKGLATGCSTTVTPAAVTFTEPTCSVTHGTYTVPTTTGVTYKVAGSTVAAGTYTVAAGGTVTVTAVASSSSYTLSGTASWPHTFTGLATGCTTTVTPVPPTVHAITACNTDGSVTWTDTAAIHYALTTGDGKSGAYQVTAYAQGSNVFAGGATTYAFPAGDLGAKTTCATVPHDASATDITCFQDAFNGTASKVGGFVTVTPVTGVKYTITGGTIVTPVVITGTTGGAAIDTKLPAGTYQVTPSALTGFTLTNPGVIPLTIADTAGLCIPTLAFTSGSVAATDQTCQSGKLVSGYITVALDPATLNYTLNGAQLAAKTNVAPGTYVVKMVPMPGFAIGSPSATVTVHASTADCGQLQTLAFTGGSLIGYGFLSAAALLFVAGGLFIQRSRRQRTL